MSRNLLDTNKSLSITGHINQRYRQYAIYVLQSRGIPNFYDSLTPVQRLIVEYAPSNYNKTLSLVGEVISSGNYHHGDLSLGSAISRLAKTFCCSYSLLNGDGFFGSPINPAPSAPRYTSVKIDPLIRDIVKKHWDLNERNSEGIYDNINIEVPIGLCTQILGIAVGYKSILLPRKIEDVIEYLSGQSKSLKPYFKNFKGKVSRFPDLENSWLIESQLEFIDKTQIINIGDLSPLLRYDKTMEKILTKLTESGIDFNIFNRSKETVDISIQIKGAKADFESIKALIKNMTSQCIRERLIFIKDGKVVEYASIHDYLNDFNVNREFILLKRLKKDNEYNNSELNYLEAKLKFLEWMLGTKRKNDEIVKWLEQWDSKISLRLSKLEIVKLSPEEIILVKSQIVDYKKTIIEVDKGIKKQEARYLTIKKDTIINIVTTTKTSSLISEELMNEEKINGMVVWNPDEDELDEMLNGQKEDEEVIEENID